MSVRPLNYYGGKATLSSWIISHFLKNYESLHYVEPFAGGLSVFFRKKPSVNESISDLNKNLYIFYRVLREKPEKLQDALEKTPYSELEFNRARLICQGKEKPVSVIDWARAVFIYYNASYAGTGISFGFKLSNLKVPHFPKSTQNKIAQLPEFFNRVQNAQIFCVSYEKMLKRFNSNEVLFYLDPPYPSTDTTPYIGNFTQKHFLNLLNFLKITRAKFVLSCHEKNLPKELPENWNVKLKTKNEKTCGTNSVTRDYKEALIRNFQ